MIKKRTGSELTTQEINLFARFCIDKGIVTDGPVGQAQLDALGNYLVDEWQVEITTDSLDAAVKAFGTQLEYLSPIQTRYRKVATQEGEARAAAVRQWVNSENNHTLVNDGSDQDYENQRVLLEELHGREITGKSIGDAIGRAAGRTGMHFAPTARKVDPRQHEDTGAFAPKTDDSREFIGGKKNHAYKTQGTAQNTPKIDPADAWQQLAERLLHHGTHSQQAAYREIYDSGRAHGKSFREIYAEMAKLKASYERVVPIRGV